MAIAVFQEQTTCSFWKISATSCPQPHPVEMGILGYLDHLHMVALTGEKPLRSISLGIFASSLSASD